MRKTASYLSLLFFSLFFSFYHHDLIAENNGPVVIWKEDAGQAKGIAIDKVPVYDEECQNYIEKLNKTKSKKTCYEKQLCRRSSFK